MGQRIPANPSSDDPFDSARRRIAQQQTSKTQQDSDMIDRAQAQAGSVGSGAFLKQKELSANANQESANNAYADVNSQQAADVRAKQEAEKNRQFQTSERLGSQSFASGERLGSQDYAAQQAALGRQFTTSERLGAQGFSKGLADQQLEFQNKTLDFQKSNAAQNFGLATEQLGLDKQVSQFNEDMANKQFDKPTAMEWWAQMLGVNTQKGGLKTGNGGAVGSGMSSLQNFGGGSTGGGGFF